MPTPWIGHSLKIDVEFVPIDVKKLESSIETSVIDGMAKLRDEIEKKWRAHAKATLGSLGPKYLEGLSVTHEKFDVDVRLSGELGVAIEEGSGRWDMKPGILKGAEARVIPMGSKANPKFRTMKARSSGWWHPGYQGRAIRTEVTRQMPRMVKDVFKPLMSRIKI